MRTPMPWPNGRPGPKGLATPSNWAAWRVWAKPARAIANRFIREMHERAAPQLAFLAQNAVTRPLRAAATRAGNPDFVALYAGQAAPLSRALPAAELVAALEAETLECLDRLATLRR